ncbi:salicylate hydroxylase [Coniophora puteana RWD-64-598 SS2]|uniref:Salicylate hydroxylase n=1 Tax=Coniophora puteana (strain RWD-64-598) TaxID=741705 RepID=A0A5M3MUJ3_CONPW|nr:salicylate hydroxylase [Coniophora puteana RWD-64-598 SS2]EIW82783.1 salicylate hydroxylase [Coniophora puteana RWD-64-598 SS2]
MSSTKLRVAICGGGVGGLTLAVTLSQYPDIEVDIYERARQFGEVGAGVGLWLRPFKVLRKLGPKLEQDLLSKTPIPYSEEYSTGMRYRKTDLDGGEDLFAVKCKGNLMQLHRADFQCALLDNVGANVKTHTSKRLKSYNQPKSDTEPITLAFEDGTTATCDVLVGADGVRSVVRAHMMEALAQDPSAVPAHDPEVYRSCIEPNFSGAVSYRTLIPADKVRAIDPNHRVFDGARTWVNRDIMTTTYPISMGKFVNFAGFTLNEKLMRTAHSERYSQHVPNLYDGEWVRPVTAEEFTAPFRTMEKDIHTLLDCVENGNIWAVHVVKVLPTQVHGRVSLLGDAAHAMTPFLGSGAGQAVEDAYLLGQLLGDSRTTRSTVPRALAAYDAVRCPFAAGIAKSSMDNGRLSAMQTDQHIPPSEWLPKVEKYQDWAWETELDGDVERALSSTALVGGLA